MKTNVGSKKQLEKAVSEKATGSQNFSSKTFSVAKVGLVVYKGKLE